jgi:hypothetical protein
MLLLSSVFAFD